MRKVTTTSDKQNYGVRLRAEPDHKTLGARLKGAFKSVMAAIRYGEWIWNFLYGHFFCRVAAKSLIAFKSIMAAIRYRNLILEFRFWSLFLPCCSLVIKSQF